jgi:hypothetical protein
MTRLSVLFLTICILVLIWHECGENPAFFCYRIGSGVFKLVRTRQLALVPISSVTHSRVAQRTSSACLNPSSTFFVRSIIRRD